LRVGCGVFGKQLRLWVATVVSLYVGVAACAICFFSQEQMANSVSFAALPTSPPLFKGKIGSEFR